MNAESDERGRTVEKTERADEPTGATAAFPAETKEPDSERELGSRAPDFIKASRPLHVSWQVGVFVAGLAVVGGGVVLLPLPGPGWLIIFGGMAIWATEFVWAQLVLRWTKRKVTEAAHKALDPRVRRRNIILTSVGVVIIAVLVGIYVWKFGVVMPWKIDQ